MVELRRIRVSQPVFIKKPKQYKKQSMLGFIKHINIKKIQYTKLYLQRLQRAKMRRVIQREPLKLGNIFTFIDLKSRGDRIPKTIISPIDYAKYSDYTTINKELFDAYTYLYENGGIRLNGKIKTHPNVFIKDAEMVVHNIDFFSCEKGSPIMEKIINDSRNIENYEELVDIFNKHTGHIRVNLGFVI